MKLVERDTRSTRPRHRRVALFPLPVFDNVPRLGFFSHLEMVASFGHALQTEHFHRRRWRRVLDGPPAIIKHRADFAKHRAADEEVARV